VRFGVIVFPGTWSDRDCHFVLKDVLGQDVDYVWHQETDLSPYDCVVLPGGFSYGDYLRPGAIARFSPVMGAVERFARDGKLVWGICNGFQILCEAGLLPGVLMPNSSLQYRCQWTWLLAENNRTPYTRLCAPGQVLKIPISHYEGRYYADDGTIEELERKGRVAFRYATPQGQATDAANPNGALHNIAGIVNEGGNVLGMMPHPERACEAVLGSEDGRLLFRSVLSQVGAQSFATRGRGL